MLMPGSLSRTVLLYVSESDSEDKDRRGIEIISSIYVRLGINTDEMPGWSWFADYNEPEIGQVFKTTKIPREEIFVTTKLCVPTNLPIRPETSHLSSSLSRTISSFDSLVQPILINSRSSAQLVLRPPTRSRRTREIPS